MSAMGGLRIVIAEDTVLLREGLAGLLEDAGHSVLARVRARAMGWNAHTQFLVPILHHELRLTLEQGQPDRRGAKR